MYVCNVPFVEDESESPVDPVAAFDEMLDQADTAADDQYGEDNDDGADGMDDFEITAVDENASDDPVAKSSNPSATEDSVEPQQETASEGQDDGDEVSEEDILAKFGAAGAKLMKRQGRRSKKDKSRSKGSKHARMQDLFKDPSQDEGATAEPALADLFDLDGSEEKKKVSDASELQSQATLNTLRKDWKVNQDLRNHLDVVQAISFHQTKLRLASASEDMTVKLWDIDPNAKKLSTEPVVTYHGHTSAVLSVAIASKADVLYSAGSDGSIYKWKMPPVGSERLMPYDANQQLASCTEHSDAVWSLDVHKDENLVMSASADGTCRIWATGGEDELVTQSVISPGLGAISCGEFVASNTKHVLLG